MGEHNLRALDPLKLDRDILGAFNDLTRAREMMDRGEIEDAPNPFRGRRHVSSKASWEELSALSPDPLFEALSEWVAWLTIARVTFEDEVAVAEAWSSKEYRSPIDDSMMSLRELIGEVRRRPSDDRKREVFFERFLASSSNAASAARRLGERRIEAARLLGADPSKLTIDVAALSRNSAREAQDLAGQPMSSSLVEVLESALARDASEGWPARLTNRFALDVFRSNTLWNGVSMKAVHIPEAMSATSFCLALANVGHEIARANLPTSTPFVLARAPRSVLARSRRALFGAMPAEPSFGRLVLGLGRDAAREQSRKVGRALVTCLAIEAMRSFQTSLDRDSIDHAKSAFEDATADTFGAPWPNAMMGVIPRTRPGDELALLAILRAAEDRSRLRDEFDEDWFRNPRALESIRHVHESAELRDVDFAKETISARAQCLKSWINEVLR